MDLILKNAPIPMEYGPKRIRILLAEGTCDGISFWIFSYGTHPCAYVEVTDFKDLETDDIDCHGGITYDEGALPSVWDDTCDGFEQGKRRFIGWDYAHCYDFIMCASFAVSGYRWTTDEILQHVEDVVSQIREITANGKKTNKEG